MHWPSHCNAFYAEWIVRFLHPRAAPWKQVLRDWLPEDNPLEDAVLVADSPDRATLPSLIPSHSVYIIRCLSEFLKLDLQQNINLESPSTMGEPLWHNARFHIHLPRSRQTLWADELQVTHISDLIDPATDHWFTDADWAGFFISTMAQVTSC